VILIRIWYCVFGWYNKRILPVLSEKCNSPTLPPHPVTSLPSWQPRISHEVSLPKGPSPTRIQYARILFQTDIGHSRSLESTDMILKLQTVGTHPRNIQTSVILPYIYIYIKTTVCPTSGTTPLCGVRQSHVQKHNRTALTEFLASKCRKPNQLSGLYWAEDLPASLSWSTWSYENIWHTSSRTQTAKTSHINATWTQTNTLLCTVPVLVLAAYCHITVV